MAHHYSPRAFLRQAPNDLLAQYFQRQGVSLDGVRLDEETEIAELWKAWEALDAGMRSAIDADFQAMDALADECGVQALLEEGRSFHAEDLEPIFTDMAGFYDKVFWAFLERPRIFQVASQFRRADQLPGRYWHKRQDNLPGTPPRDGEAACYELADALGTYFQLSQGRGRSCEVEVYRRDARYYYFCFSEDYGRTQMEFEAGRLARRAHRPAFEVVFVYLPGGALDTHFAGPKKVRRELEEIFGRVILEVELPDIGKDERVYNLNALKDPHFDFVFPSASGLVDVRVKELRLTILGDEFRRLSVEADPSTRRESVYELLSYLLETSSPTAGPQKRIPLSLCNVTRVGLRAYFTDPTSQKTSTRTFHVSYPNACDLKQEGKDLVLRDMLASSGLEPRPAAPISDQ